MYYRLKNSHLPYLIYSRLQEDGGEFSSRRGDWGGGQGQEDQPEGSGPGSHHHSPGGGQTNRVTIVLYTIIIFILHNSTPD